MILTASDIVDKWLVGLIKLKFEVSGCVCVDKVICKEEIQRERCNNSHSGDLKQLTSHPQVDDEIKLPVRVFKRFISK